MNMENPVRPRIPSSTYRLQFNRNFRFNDAKRIIPYLNDLGITDIYSSPYFKAREGSVHGYDIVDHGSINPEVGSEDEYNGMVEELKRRGMGQILDIVPNHMCVASGENKWWMDVLENGPSSRYAGFFDIDWEPVKKELKDKVLLPVLGDQYGTVLENRELRLAFEDGCFLIYYYEHRFPVRLHSYKSILGHGIDALGGLIGKDHPHFAELLSIITAVSHLPPYTELDPSKVEERYREKEIIKRRLGELCRVNQEIGGFIDENLKLYNGVKGEPKSFDLLDGLLRDQVYRLSHWRVATEEINYRRFFDINELAAIKMEKPDVFEETHRLVMRLVSEGKVTGLRVDHPDGLYDPAEYFRLLQKNCYLMMRAGSEKDEENAAGTAREYEWLLTSDPGYKPFYIVGEKILIRGERMPEDWPIFSTTGYVFLNSLNGIFIDSSNARAIDGIYARFAGDGADFQEIVYEKKKLIMEVAMSGEINTLAHLLNGISEEDRHTRDFTLNSLKAAIIEVIACFPVYRTYANPAGINERDRRYIEAAVYRAKRKNPAINESTFDFLKQVLVLNYPGHFEEGEKKEWLDFAMRFQQITGPLTAKGVEDTAFYAYNRFTSLNEVGGSPDRFGIGIDTFHGQNIERSKFWPHALITTSTHDTKRSEDVRARLNVLSEIPDEWRERVMSWGKMNRKNKTAIDNIPAPDRNEEYLLYQTLTGAWPPGEMDDPSYKKFGDRIKEYMLKAAREAKINSSWINPNVAYEKALTDFIEKILSHPESDFLRDFLPFQKKVSRLGMFNSLSQTLLKITSPGVPDFYQGAELWDFSLVDPDNRRPVDYDLRMRLLDELKRRESEITSLELARELVLSMGNDDKGKIKLYLTWKALNFRKGNRELFETGEYVPLEGEGVRADNICAFLRKTGKSSAVVIVPRLPARFAAEDAQEPWGETIITLPTNGGSYRNIFTGEILVQADLNGSGAIRAADLFNTFPVALLEVA